MAARAFRFLRLVLLATLVWLALTAPPAWAAAEGTITALAASDAPAPGDSVSITASLAAVSNLGSSNVLYQILAPDGVTVVATRQTSVPALKAGETFNDAWSTTNTAFPETGAYTLTACWSKGNKTDCKIDSKTTTFYSVPTLGWGLTGLALVLLGVFLWKRRAEFARR